MNLATLAGDLQTGFGVALSPDNLLVGMIGVLLGTAVGVLPGLGPSVAIATYDPQTGQFATPDGTVATQPDVVAGGGQREWTDLLPTG